jgi:hypothetical protein
MLWESQPVVGATVARGLTFKAPTNPPFDIEFIEMNSDFQTEHARIEAAYQGERGAYIKPVKEFKAEAFREEDIAALTPLRRRM